MNKKQITLENVDLIPTQFVDLLGERVGGRAISCSDEWFATCDNLVKPGRGVFEAGKFVSTGQLMDGWESRRSFNRRFRNDTGPDQNDWCVLRMGLQGVIHFFDIDTNHFRGNSPERVMVQAASIQGEPGEDTVWTTVLSPSDVSPHSQNWFACDSTKLWTHLKLSMFPDGGIARFRAYGEVRLNPNNYVTGELIDLASISSGARGMGASDLFFSSPQNLTLPGRGIDMGDGWETKRRRDEHNDWSILKLGIKGSIRKVVIDTAHFKGNYPDSASLQAVNADDLNLSDDELLNSDTQWQTVINQSPLYGDKEHVFINEIDVDSDIEFTHVKLNIFPDGGVSRLRVWGAIDWKALLEIKGDN